MPGLSFIVVLRSKWILCTIIQAIENELGADAYETPEVRHDIAFHMTDRLADLEEWLAFCQSPVSYRTPTKLSSFYFGFEFTPLMAWPQHQN